MPMKRGGHSCFPSKPPRTVRAKLAVEEDDDDENGEEGDDVIQMRNIVFFHAPVSRATILKLIQKLDEAATFVLTHDLEVILYIHSEGGDAYAGLSGMNHIQTCRARVHCVADGLVASAATFLLLGGHKRSGLQHSTVLIHQLSTGFWGKFVDLQDEVQNSQQLMTILADLYTTKTKLKRSKVEKIMKKELTMTASHCVEIGLFEKILT